MLSLAIGKDGITLAEESVFDLAAQGNVVVILPDEIMKDGRRHRLALVPVEEEEALTPPPEEEELEI